MLQTSQLLIQLMLYVFLPLWGIAGFIDWCCHRAIRIGDLVGDSSLREMAYNKYPHYLVGPWNLGQRFLMHGFFTEQLYAYLEQQRLASSNPAGTCDA